MPIKKAPAYFPEVPSSIGSYVMPKASAPPAVQYSGPGLSRQQPSAIGSANSPYYYGGGGTNPLAAPIDVTPVDTGDGSSFADSSAPSGFVNPYIRSIQDLPEYAQAGQRRQSSLDALRMALRQANQNAVIASGFGIDPSKLTGDFGSDIDPTTLAAAQQNQFSTKAQLDLALSKGLGALPYSLGSRARSGSAGTHASDLNRQYDVQTNQAQNALLSALTGNVGNYFNQQAPIEQGYNDALAAMEARLANQPYGPTEVTNAAGTGPPSQAQNDLAGLPLQDGGGPQRQDAFDQLANFIPNISSTPAPYTIGGVPFASGATLGQATQATLAKVRKRKG